MAEARIARRQRKLDQAEIPEDQVLVTDELLGSGGFGKVYLADINGRNAAAKVLTCVSVDPSKREGFLVAFFGHRPSFGEKQEYGIFIAFVRLPRA